MVDEAAAREAFALFLKAGLTGAQACGPLASIEIESGFNPRAVGDHGQAHSLCQWHPDRVAHILHGCGIDVRTAGFDQCVEACIWELQHVETEAWNALRRAHSPQQAAAAFVTFYERPANLRQQIAIRAAAAGRWAKVFGV